MSKNKKSPLKLLMNGLLYENPVLILLLGTCPALAVTTTATNGLAMGLAATFVLLGSNIVISLLRNIIPQKVRIPSFIVVIAGFVTVVEMLMEAFTPDLYEPIAFFISLIVVNCIILARAEMFASKNGVFMSIFDAIGMGAGFTFTLVLMGALREVFGSGTFFGLSVPVMQAGGVIEPIGILVSPPGGFFVLGILIALVEFIARKLDAKTLQRDFAAGCGACGGCGPTAATDEAATDDDDNLEEISTSEEGEDK